MRTPREAGFVVPPDLATHERTLMAWPCRRELWEAELGAAKAEYAGVANAIAAFEPVTMVCRDEADAAEARAALAGAVDVEVRPLDDSWLRDSGPVFALHEDGRRAGVHFRFNAWGERFAPYDSDEATGGALAAAHADEVFEAPFVLEGGAFAIDGGGAVLTTEQCLLHPNRNPSLDRAAIEQGLLDFLGAQRVVWLGRGLAEDRDTDGHVDLVCFPLGPGRVLLQEAPPGTPDHEALLVNAARARDAGFEVTGFPVLPHAEVAGERVVVSHLNLYACNDAVVVPLAGAATDEEALDRLRAVFWPLGREVVGVPGATIAFGGGGPHCITQQVPARVP